MLRRYEPASAKGLCEMMELLRLSESRAALVGGIAVDTVCMGTLALLLIDDRMFEQGHAGVVVLVSLAITAPVLATCAMLLSFVLAGRFDVEERARRTLLSATVLHGAVQLSVLFGMICGNGPQTVSSYFISVWLAAAALSASLIPLVGLLRKLRKQPKSLKPESPPSAKL